MSGTLAGGTRYLPIRTRLKIVGMVGLGVGNVWWMVLKLPISKEPAQF